MLNYQRVKPEGQVACPNDLTARSLHAKHIMEGPKRRQRMQEATASFDLKKLGRFYPWKTIQKLSHGTDMNWWNCACWAVFLILRSSFGDDEVVVLQHAHLVKWCRPADCARPRIMLRMPMLLYLLFSGCSQSCFVPRLQKIPSGKRSYRKSSRKSPLLMGKSTISTGPFSIATLVITRG